MFLVTDVGLYISFDKGKKWNHWKKGLPQVQVNDMKIHPVEDDLVLGTFGRAFYILDDINPLREIASKGTELLNAEFDVLNTAPGYLVSYRSVDGVRFAGQGEFKGENRAYDRIGFNVWKKPVEKKEGEKSEAKDEKPSQAKISIYDNNGKVIRRIRRSIVRVVSNPDGAEVSFSFHQVPESGKSPSHKMYVKSLSLNFESIKDFLIKKLFKFL